MEAVEAIIEVNKIFKTKQWFEKDIEELAFNGFCKLFSSLESNQRKLILELTSNYQWISHNEYQTKIVDAMQSIATDELTDVNKVFFFPIVKPGDEIKSKSGDHLLYLIKAFKHFMTKYSNIKFEYLKTFEQLNALVFKANERLFLIDDYIGSGETLDFCIGELHKNDTLPPGAIKILCIAIQEEAQYNLVMNGYGVLKSALLKRGITDYNNPADAQQKKDLMREIERHIPGSKSFSLGYAETEALVTMARTPDNTFPVFWKKFRKDGNYIDPPFARFD